MEAIEQCESKLRDIGVKEQCFLVLRVHDDGVSLDLMSPSVPGGFMHGVFVPWEEGVGLEPDFSVVYYTRPCKRYYTIYPDTCKFQTKNLYPLFKELLPKIYNYAYQLDQLDLIELDQIEQRVRVFDEMDVMMDVIPNDLEWMTHVFGLTTFIWDLNLI